ncbi:MAG: hypothetical protein RLZZ156_1819 [Deinococcota bacterium]|jgi:hypothetical protein
MLARFHGLFEMGVRQIVALKMGAEGSFVMTRDGTCHATSDQSAKSLNTSHQLYLRPKPHNVV